MGVLWSLPDLSVAFFRYYLCRRISSIYVSEAGGVVAYLLDLSVEFFRYFYMVGFLRSMCRKINGIGFILPTGRNISTREKNANRLFYSVHTSLLLGGRGQGLNQFCICESLSYNYMLFESVGPYQAI